MQSDATIRSSLKKCKEPTNSFNLAENKLVCNKFGDRYKCYTINIKKPDVCNYVGKEEGIDQIVFAGEFPNAIISIGRPGGNFTIPDLAAQGEISCDVFNNEAGEVSLACHKY